MNFRVHTIGEDKRERERLREIKRERESYGFQTETYGRPILN